MDSNTANEGLPETTTGEDNEPNVEMPSQNEEATSASPSSAPNTPKMDKGSKVTIILRPAGSTPVLKQKRWEVDRSQTVGFIASFIRKKLSLQKSDSLFFFVNQSFAPALDQTIENLFECFGAEGKLLLHYCRTQAWG